MSTWTTCRLESTGPERVFLNRSSPWTRPPGSRRKAPSNSHPAPEDPITFCLGINLAEGLVALADTRITSGNEVITAKKVKLYQRGPKTSFFVMTSGLRSVRDKSLTYFEDALDKEGKKFDRIFKVLNCYAEQIRRVSDEDRRYLEDAGLHFNIHALVGGQLAGDKEHKLYLIYPQGNWVEIGEGTPYQIIGAAPYGKPVLDRTLKHGDPIPFALKVGSLAFDSTRISAADVDFPVDVVVYRKDSFRMLEKRFTKEDMAENAEGWQTRLRDSVNKMPSSWFDGIFPKEVADARAAKPSAEPRLPAKAKAVPEQPAQAPKPVSAASVKKPSRKTASKKPRAFTEPTPAKKKS